MIGRRYLVIQRHLGRDNKRKDCPCRETTAAMRTTRGLYVEYAEKRNEIGQVVDSDIRFAVERSQCTWLAALDPDPRESPSPSLFLTQAIYAGLPPSLSGFSFLGSTSRGKLFLGG